MNGTLMPGLNFSKSPILICHHPWLTGHDGFELSWTTCNYTYVNLSFNVFKIKDWWPSEVAVLNIDNHCNWSLCLHAPENNKWNPGLAVPLWCLKYPSGAYTRKPNYEDLASLFSPVYYDKVIVKL